MLRGDLQGSVLGLGQHSAEVDELRWKTRRELGEDLASRPRIACHSVT